MPEPLDPRLMNGTQLAADMVASAARRAKEFRDLTGRPPCLATVLVGEDPASVTYVKMKQNRCAKAGIESRRVTLEERPPPKSWWPLWTE